MDTQDTQPTADQLREQEATLVTVLTEIVAPVARERFGALLMGQRDRYLRMLLDTGQSISFTAFVDTHTSPYIVDALIVDTVRLMGHTPVQLGFAFRTEDVIECGNEGCDHIGVIKGDKPKGSIFTTRCTGTPRTGAASGTGNE